MGFGIYIYIYVASTGLVWHANENVEANSFCVSSLFRMPTKKRREQLKLKFNFLEGVGTRGRMWFVGGVCYQ